MTLGIVNLKKFILVFIQAGTVIEDILGDGKVSIIEGVQAGVKLSPELMTLLNMDYLGLTKEWLDLDSKESAELSKFVGDQLNLDNDDAEMFIEKAFSIGIEISVMGKKVFGLFKGIKTDAPSA